MSTRIQHHPRFAELSGIFQNHPDLFREWRGTLFRFQTVDFPAPKDVLSGEGAQWRGGRWNLPGIATLYGSTTDTTALEECKANDRYYGVETKGPRLLVAIDARLGLVLDLTSPGIRRALGVTLTDLGAEDWRKLLAAGKESFTQCIGRAVAATGGGGVIARSAAVRSGVNVIVYPGARAGDHLEVVEGEKLEKLGFRIKV